VIAVIGKFSRTYKAPRAVLPLPVIAIINGAIYFGICF